MAGTTLEERVKNLESRQDALQELVERSLPSHGTGKGGWRSIVGTFKDDPLYDEAMRLGRAWREAERDNQAEDER